MNAPLIDRRSDKPQAYDGEERRRQQHYLDLAQQARGLRDTERLEFVIATDATWNAASTGDGVMCFLVKGRVCMLTAPDFRSAIDSAIAAQAKEPT